MLFQVDKEARFITVKVAKLRTKFYQKCQTKSPSKTEPFKGTMIKLLLSDFSVTDFYFAFNEN